ncbi:MAG TPA: ABC transporter ATP-binding protein [Stellaceae bacterium]|nr:ABC transporter ATP-binding protein [Stellaceae bacterium]
MSEARPNVESPSHGFEELRLDRVTRRFHETTALDELTLSIRRGEFIALLGPSGCGKSTALNCIAGLLPLTGGSIWLDERRIDVLRPEERGFGMVFQNYALFPHMSVRRNIGFGLQMRGVPRAEIRKRTDAALELVQLGAHAEKLPGQLSGGQQQRVALARAVVIDPPVILMDEPLSNLDAKLRLEMRHELRRIHHEVRRATIYVTHDQDEALSLADRIVVLHDGVVQQIGTPEELYGRPANLLVARFMGYRNILEFDLTGTDGGTAQLASGGLQLRGSPQSTALGSRVTAAIRPEEIALGSSRNAITGTVSQVEYCGRDYLVDVVTDAGILYLRTERRLQPEERVQLSVAPERVLVFPSESDAGAATPGEQRAS